jgi:hypothetical protein
MVSVQLGCTVSDAMERLAVYAEETDRSIDEVADEVVNRVIRFDP